GKHELSGVDLGLPGMVDAPRGFVYWSPSLADRNVALGSVLAEAVRAPLFIDNDVNLVAKAEQLYGYGRNVSDFIVVTIEHGVGMGIVIDNRIYRGTRGRGAEFGHTKVQLDGALCRCGQRGCLEAYVADYALLREAGIVAEFSGDAPPEKRLTALCDAAKSGDGTALTIFQRAGRMLAMGLANVVNIFDPELIILTGERMQLDHLYADDVIDRVKSYVMQTGAPPPEVRIHKWGDLMWARGAAAYAMEGVSTLAIQEVSGDAD
ncbi:MAG: ROK family protein, partial [Paracoccaceae bacterium]